MTTMGRPVNAQEQAFRQVSMGPRDSGKSERQISETEKERLLNKITGYKPKSIYSDKPKDQIGKDEFLKLLTHQLKNQDPMNPMEQNKFAAELAQFSQLEQLSNINTKFDTFNNNKAMETQFYGASFLGKEVVTSGQTMNFQGEGTEANIMFRLDKNAERVLARVFDKQNNIVGEVWKENIGRGNQTFTWDGYMLDGQPAGKGDFNVRIFAWDKNSDPINVETKVTGTVESVFFENGETVLQVDGKKVFLRDVDSFHQPGVNQAQQPQQAMNAAQAAPQPMMQNNAEANTAVQKLPIENSLDNNVNLNTRVNSEALNQYKRNDLPGTGLTDVYDIE